jgi:IS30 family transposase
MLQYSKNKRMRKYEKVYANQIKKLKWLDKSLKTHILPRLNHEKNGRQEITSKQIKLLIKISMSNILKPDDFIKELY